MAAGSVGEDSNGGESQRLVSRAERALQPSDPPDQGSGLGDEVDFEDDCGRSELGNENFKVVIRVRPPLPRELQGLRPFENTVVVDPDQRVITLSENLASLQGAKGGSMATFDNGMVYNSYRYTFDRVYDAQSEQSEVYEHSARDAVHQALEGYNAAIIAYGQTGTGKTFTMEGSASGASRGIIPRAIEDVFGTIGSDAVPHSKFLVRASYLQIYNEVISDLLKPERTNLVIREDRKRGVFVDGLSEWVVRSPAEVYGLMERGAEQRAKGATKLNELSSRSHAVFIIIVEKSTGLASEASANNEQMAAFEGLHPGMGRQAGAGGSVSVLAADVRQSVRVGKLNLVDLAGSERVHITGAKGKRLEESKKINQSLSALGNVIAALTDQRGVRAHVPYRDSKLTRILEDSLGGNCKTTMMCMISPALDAYPESLSTLKFANRAKNIKNLAQVNEDLDQRTLLRKYERELRRLRAELQQRQRQLVDKRHLLAVEEQKRRAEADKLAAITALEQRSREFMMEKEAKGRLEARISSMQSQLLIGGAPLEDTPVFRTLLAKEQRRIRSEYEQRLQELERERGGVEEDRAQVDRYKQLLLKQRDIMIALTARLNERDEQILTMQEELEAYDVHQKKLEDALDQKTSELIALRKAAVQHTAGEGAGDANPAAAAAAAATLQSALGAWASHSMAPRESMAGAALGPLLSAEALDSSSEDSTPTGERQRAGSALADYIQRTSLPGDQLHSDDVGGGRHRGGGVEVVLQRESTDSVQLAGDGEALRAAEAGRADAEVAREEAEHAAEQLLRENRRLQRVLLAEREAAEQAQGSSAEDVAALQEQCSTALKERAAIRVILDAKIRSLVAQLGRGLQELPSQGSERLGSHVMHAHAMLENLVNATVNAMGTGR